MHSKLIHIWSRISSLLKLPMKLILSCLLLFAPDLKAAGTLVVKTLLFRARSWRDLIRNPERFARCRQADRPAWAGS